MRGKIQSNAILKYTIVVVGFKVLQKFTLEKKLNILTFTK